MEHCDEEDYPECEPPEMPPAFPPEMSIEELAGELPVKHLVSLALAGTTAQDENAALAIYQRVRENLAAEIAAGATPEQMPIMIATMSHAAAITFLRDTPGGRNIFAKWAHKRLHRRGTYEEET
jgi:hypothetical protein